MTTDIQRAVPNRVGPYRVLRRIGSGGMAEVFLALRCGASGFEKQVAIKTLLPELRGDAAFERLLIEEGRRGATLAHRNIVAVYDLGIDDGSYYLCLEYVDGTTLAAAPPPPAPLPVALLIAEELVTALCYVHGCRDPHGQPLGLVHRDVSPNNILISRAGEVKLADFGVAKATLLADQTWGRFHKGTIAYMSPEQVAGTPLTPASDQFGLGTLLCELVSGQRPFDGESVVETMNRIRDAESPALKTVPALLQPIVRRCLQRQPDARFADTTELLRAITGVRRQFEPVGLAEIAEWALGQASG
jgi:eukaryotic-like serine/threonine-protein kinase